MDYNDNEFQSQNLQLAGEGNNKVSPVLRPYALPKFDFDDSLLGHLRFDSLVETEVFLGIESNEDNQWIEEYSRGGSGLEFRTSAAESCSISRHNNVWSEAASLESVEMLLKSVGQEENIPGKTNMRESDACDELRCVVQQMEPSMIHDDESLYKGGNDIDIQPIISPHEILGNCAVSKEDIGGDKPLVDTNFRKDHCESSVDGGASDPVSDAVSGKGKLTLSKEIYIVDQSKVHTSIGSPDNTTEEESSTSGMQLDTVVCSSPNVSRSGSELKRQDTQHQKVNITETVDVSQTEVSAQRLECNFVQEAETNYQNLDGHNVNSPHSETPMRLTSRIESPEEGKIIESASGTLGDSSNLTKEDADLYRVEGCSENLLSAKCANQVPLQGFKVGEISEVTILGTSPAAFGCDNSLERLEVDRAIDCKSPDLLPEVNQLSKGEAIEKSDSHRDEVSTTNTELSSTALPSEKPVSLTSEGAHDACMDGSNTDVQDSPVTMAGSIEVCEGNGVPRQSDVNYMAVDVKASAELPSDCSYMHQEVVDGSAKVELIVSESLSDSIIRTESALESDDTTEGSILPSENVGAAAANIHQEVQSVGACNEESQCGPRLTVPDEVSQDRIKEVDGCTLVRDSTREVQGAEIQVISEMPEVTMNETPEKRSSKVSDAESLPKKSEMLSQPSPVEEIQGEVKSVREDNEFKLISGDKTSGHVAGPCIDALEVHEVSVSSTPLAEPDAKFPDYEGASGGACLDKSACGSPVIGATELSHIENEKEGVSICSSPLSEPDAKISDPESANGGAHHDKSACGSPTIIRATELSRIENVAQGVRGSTDQNTPPSVDVDEDANKFQPISPDFRRTDSKGDKSFTFEVCPPANSSEKKAGKNWQPFSTVQATAVSMIVEGTPSTSGVCQTSSNSSKGASRENLQTSKRVIVRSVSRGTSERKPKRTASKAARKETAKKGNQTKDTTPTRQSEKGDRTSHVPLIPSGINQLVQSSEMQFSHMDGSMKFLSMAPALPDLNTSSPSIFQQPFTDLQQVQLRAQIFVYGALIQGAAPDEPYMISAFGGPDGGRSMWETEWRAYTQRLHGQKSLFNDAETPLQSRLGAKAPDQATTDGVITGKVASPPLGRAISKGIPSPTVNPIIPLSSPLWSISTPPVNTVQSSGFPRTAVLDYQQTLTPLHPQQTPSIRNLVGHNTSWMSPVPFHASWVPSPQTSGFDAGAHIPVLPMTETVQLTSAKELLVPTSGVKHLSSGPVIQNMSPATVFPGASSLLDPRKISSSPSQHSTHPKPRKRKKIVVSEDLGQIILHSQSQTEPVSAPVLSSHMSASVSFAPPASVVTKASTEKVIMPVSPSAPADLVGPDKQAQQKNPLSDETLSKLKEAKTQAEDATTVAAVAVSHCQEIWNQLGKHSTSGLESDVESKLTYAAVAIATAAAVAKAAAAAANVASNAALQAKLMAYEALDSSFYRNSNQISGFSLSDNVKEMGKSTAASTFKGKSSMSGSSSIIFAAREAAKRHVEAASAASKRAENMDAIVKAAELAATAVSHAGKIVALSDPLPLADLIEVGPEGFWKVPQISTQLVVGSDEVNSERFNADAVGKGQDTSAKHVKEVPSQMVRENETGDQGMFPTLRNISSGSFDDHGRLVDDISGFVVASEKNAKGQKDNKTSDLAKTIGVVPESEIGSKSLSVEPLDGKSIKDGSCVEVFKEGVQLKAGWYTANISSLKDGKAFVCYNELPSDGDSEKLKEWVALEGERDKAPKIRIARPANAMAFEGTRKRRRAALGEYTFSVGDRVDAWMDNSWWEGVVMEKSKKDETMFTIHFPAHGQTSAVGAWHLRQSLIWKDGEWVEWSNSKGNIHTCQEGDTPQEKRLRLGSPTAVAKGKDKILKSDAIVESGSPDEPTLLDLAANERRFNMGKSSRDENKPDALRMVRTGLQKEGSRVVFGVPKPGKKRKFMDVSKHYVVDQSSKATGANDSVKFAKYLMPQSQGSGSRGWKNALRSEFKEKRPAISRPKVLKSGKPPTVSVRRIPQKENSASATVSTSDDGADKDQTEKIKDFVRRSDYASGKHDSVEVQSLSSSEGTAEAPIEFSAVPHSSDAPFKRGSQSNSRAELVTKGKLAPVGGKLNKLEEEKVINANYAKTSSEVAEPRRSNRRIQPTSRLLEGLQSSLIISKMPSASHEKIQKSQNRSIPKGNSHS